jgi:hypothetical protein
LGFGGFWAKIFLGSYTFGVLGSFDGWVNRNLELFGGNKIIF